MAIKDAGMAVSVCRGHGTQGTLPFGRYLRDVKAHEVAGGSVEIRKNTIAKSRVNEVKRTQAA